jgi:hypothetical protein
LYVIDFDINQDLRGLLQEVWSANIAKYWWHRKKHPARVTLRHLLWPLVTFRWSGY